ncbi:hypothetical protein D3C85_1489990 [compost metagenome]
MEPAKKSRSQVRLWLSRAFTRKSKATPRSVRPMSISVTGRYSSPSTRPCAFGKATSRMPTPSTSQVSLASQNGPMEATITSFSASVARCMSMPTPRS